MKKLAIVLGCLVGLFVIAAVAIPLFVNVDKYRPQIVDMADQQLNGKLELGKLSLSLWGQVRIEIDGVTLTDAGGHKLVAVKGAWFHVPFSSILAGSPELEFQMDGPELEVVKNKAGKLNLMSLMKGDQYVGAAAFDQPKKAGGGDIALPALVARARLGVELRSANLTYNDETTGLKSQFNNLNLVMKDISLSHPTEIHFWSDLDTTLGKTLAVKGQAKLDGEAKPSLADGKFDHVSLTAKLNADDLEISMPGTFEKKKGVAANADLALTASPREAKIEHLNAKFFNADIDVSGSVANIGGQGETEPVARLSMKSNGIELKPWVELVPMLKEYELGGTASLSAEASGPAAKLAYEAELKVDGLTAKAARLKSQPRFDIDVHVVTNKVDRLALLMKAPGNELKITGSIANFAAPKADFQITSSGMDLDQLVDFPPPSKSAASGEGKLAGGGAAGPKADLDAMLAPIRANKMIKEMAANVNVDFKSFKAKNVQMDDVVAKIYFKDLTAGIESFAMKLWSGTVRASASVALAPEHPTYQFSTQTAGLDLKQAMTSQYEVFKNTVIGTANMSASGQGSSLNPDAAIRNMNAKGNFKVVNAEFTSIDVGKMATDALNNSIDRIGNKFSALKGKKLNAPSGGKGTKYESMTADFTVSAGRFSMPNFTAKAIQNQGIDLKGATTVVMKDYGLSASWQLIDTYNLTHAKDLSPQINGVQVEHILAEKNQPVQFPVTVGGTLMSPSYGYGEVPEYLGKVALNNVTGAATGKAKALAQQQASQLIQQHAPPAVQNAASNALKKLFH